MFNIKHLKEKQRGYPIRIHIEGKALDLLSDPGLDQHWWDGGFSQPCQWIKSPRKVLRPIALLVLDQ